MHERHYNTDGHTQTTLYSTIATNTVLTSSTLEHDGKYIMFQTTNYALIYAHKLKAYMNESV